MTDIVTVMTKEWKEMFLSKGRGLSQRGGPISLLIMLIVFGIVIPLQTGVSWLTSPISLVLWAWVPFLLITSVVADSFAGERDRNTLETLLATRLPDRAILFGKLGAAVSYGWGFSLATLVVSTIVINVAHGHGQLLMYAPGILIGIIGLSLLVSVLAAGLGVWVSLRAASMQQAQQQLSLAMFLLFAVPVFGFQLLSRDTKLSVVTAVASGDATSVVIVISIVVLILDVIFIGLAMARFQRAQLILD
jgi:ABC-2 type transport system permease protein